MQVRVHGLSEREGDTAFAFLVLRLATPIERDGLAALIRQLAPMVLDAERFAAELPEDCESAMRLVGMPWSPPADEPALAAQRALIEGAGVHGIEEAWFFQTGTSLPAARDEDGDDDDDDDDDDDGDDDLAGSDDWADGDDDEPAWTHGAPPQLTDVRFPVDGYPAILHELDWEDFGLALKLAGPWTPGESTVLLGFHAMWLAPYGGRYRNAAVTIDQRHHAAHLWVDRFAVPCSAEEQVHHLLWIASQLAQVLPIVHARFAGATMAQKYGGLLGESSEDFVLGGNPVMAAHAFGGEAGVDAWLVSQTEWSNDEIAQMLRELAIEIVTRREPAPAVSSAEREPPPGQGDGPEGERTAEPPRARTAEPETARTAEPKAELEGALEAEAALEDELEDELDAIFEAAGLGIEEDAAADAGDLDVDDLARELDRADQEIADDADDEPVRSRQLTAYASELLVARARAGRLDPRAADHLRPLLAVTDAPEYRLISIVAILGAARDAGSVPAMLRLLEAVPAATAQLDLRTATARALGEIGDPAAIPALSELATAPGTHDDELRRAAASALVGIQAALAEREQVN